MAGVSEYATGKSAVATPAPQSASAVVAGDSGRASVSIETQAYVYGQGTLEGVGDFGVERGSPHVSAWQHGESLGGASNFVPTVDPETATWETRQQQTFGPPKLARSNVKARHRRVMVEVSSLRGQKSNPNAVNTRVAACGPAS